MNSIREPKMEVFRRRSGVTQEGQLLIFEETADSSDFLLADFDIDDATLKSKHTSFLDETLEFMAKKLSARKAVKIGRAHV